MYPSIVYLIKITLNFKIITLWNKLLKEIAKCVNTIMLVTEYMCF